MSKNVIICPVGELFKNSILLEVFDNKQLVCINKLRNELLNIFPNLREKLNKSSKYFGFGIDKSSDVFYIYLQKKKMILDINLPYTMKNQLIEAGLTISERKNFQAQSGWITGVHIDYTCSQFDTIKNIVTTALRNT